MRVAGRNMPGLAALPVLVVAALPVEAGLVDIRIDFNGVATAPRAVSKVIDSAWFQDP